jgi:O-antigen ligase
MSVGQEWWRPAPPAGLRMNAGTIGEPGSLSSPVAFGALMVFTVILLFAPQNYFRVLVPLRIASGAAIMAILAYVFDRIRHHQPLSISSREIVIAALLLGWAVLTVPMSLWPGGSVETLRDQYLKSLIIFWLLCNVVVSLSRFRQIAWVLSLLTLPLSLTGVTNYVTGKFITASGFAVQRISGYDAGLTSNPNDLALMLNLILPLSVALLLTETRTHRRFLLLAIITCSIAAIGLTFSRGGFVTLASISLMYVWRFRRRPERRWVYAALVLAFAAIPFLAGGYFERISTIGNVSADQTGSSEARWRDSLAALRFIAKHPVIGAGIGSDQEALNQERGPTWSNIHNAYLQYGVDLGIPGLVLFLLMLFGLLGRLREVRRRAAAAGAHGHLFYFAEGVEVALWAFAIAALFHPVAYNFYFYYMAGIGLGLSASVGVPRKASAASPVTT